MEKETPSGANAPYGRNNQGKWVKWGKISLISHLNLQYVGQKKNFFVSFFIGSILK